MNVGSERDGRIPRQPRGCSIAPCAAPLLAIVMAVAQEPPAGPSRAPAALAVLAELLDDDAAVVLSARLRIEALSQTERVALVRSGLASTHLPTALGAALFARPRTLDVNEQRRLAELALPRCLTLPEPFDFAEFGDVITPADVSRELILAPPLPRVAFEHLGVVHRALRPEHTPLLAQATHSDDWFLRRDALHYLAVVARGSESHREAIALAVLAWNEATQDLGDADPTEELVPARPLRIQLPDASPGYPRTLVAVARRLWLAPCGEALAAFRPWARRWLLDAVPAPADVPLLSALSAADDDDVDSVRHAAIASLARVSSDSARAALAECITAADDEALHSLALAASARGGDEAAQDRCRALAANGDGFAIAALLGLEDNDEAAIARLAFGDGDRAVVARAILVIEALGSALGPEIRPLFPIDASMESWLAAQAEAANLDRRRLAALMTHVPGARTGPLRRRLLATFQQEDLSDTIAAILEVTDRDGFAARLRTLRDLASEAGRTDDVIAIDRVRLRLGDPSDGVALLEFARTHDADPHCLSRSAAPELAAAMRTLLGANDSATDSFSRRLPTALCAVEGLDEAFARNLGESSMDLTEQVRASASADELRMALARRLAERPLDAPIVPRTGTMLAFPPTALLVRSWLERVRDARESGHYAEAIAELALGGDAPSQRELRRAQAMGLYLWFDDLPYWALAREGMRPDPDDWWSALEGNCCSFAAIASRLEDWYELDAFVDETGFQSRSANLHEVFARHAQHWRFSRYVGRFVIAP